MNETDLVRDFRSEVSPPDAERIARVRAALMAEISAAPQPARRARRMRLRWALTGATAAAVLAAGTLVAVTSFVGGGGGAPVVHQLSPGVAAAAVIRHAKHALAAPPNTILHYKLISVEGDTRVGSESWQLTTPPYSTLGVKGELGNPDREGDYADDGTNSSWYDPASNTIHVVPDTTKLRFTDPLARVRHYLGSGEAKLLGTVTFKGVAAYKIRFAKRNAGDPGLVGYFDKRSYKPLLLENPKLRVVEFEYLPATKQNLKLLDMRARHPGAQVVNGG